MSSIFKNSYKIVPLDNQLITLNEELNGLEIGYKNSQMDLKDYLSAIKGFKGGFIDSLEDFSDYRRFETIEAMRPFDNISYFKNALGQVGNSVNSTDNGFESHSDRGVLEKSLAETIVKFSGFSSNQKSKFVEKSDWRRLVTGFDELKFLDFKLPEDTYWDQVISNFAYGAPEATTRAEIIEGVLSNAAYIDNAIKEYNLTKKDLN